jgi:Cu/Ag efflux protein CusF
MKKVAGVFAGSMAVLMLVSPVLAQSSSPVQPSMKDSTTGTTTAPTTTEKGTATAPSEKHVKLGLMHHVTANVVSVDQSAKTLTVKKGAKGKEMTFTVQDNATPRLSDLKEGDRVKVSYKKDHDQLMATDIAKSSAAKSSKY